MHIAPIGLFVSLDRLKTTHSTGATKPKSVVQGKDKPEAVFKKFSNTPYGNLRVNKITCRTSCHHGSTVCPGCIEWALTSTSASGSCCSANQILHRHSQKRRVLHRLLSLIPLDRSARRKFPNTPPISIDGPSRSRDNLHLDAPEVLHVHRASSCDESTSYVSCL